MTLSQMISKCITLLGSEYAVSADDEQQLEDKLRIGINSAYQQVARDYCPPVKEQSVTTGSDRCVLFSALSEEILGFSDAFSADGVHYFGRMGIDRLYISAPAGSTVTLRYTYIPEPMTLDSDVPEVREGQMSNDAYIFGALSMLASQEGRHTDAASWEERQRAVLQGTRSGIKRMPIRRWL